MERATVDRKELLDILLFLEERVRPDQQGVARSAIQIFLNKVEDDSYFQGIDIFSLADRALFFCEKYSPSILQVEVDGNDAVLTIYHGNEDTYGDFESLELYRLPFATKTEFNLLEMVQTRIEGMFAN